MLAAELHRAVASADAVPPGWRVAARACFAWAGLDADPAALVYDSREVRGAAVETGTAGRPVEVTARELRFSSGAVTLEVELDAGADKLRLLARLAPARAATVVVRWPEGSVVSHSDDAGTFRFDELPRRPLCLHVPDPPAVKTAWIVA
jgi:hypothetical protein